MDRVAIFVLCAVACNAADAQSTTEPMSSTTAVVTTGVTTGTTDDPLTVTSSDPTSDSTGGTPADDSGTSGPMTGAEGESSHGEGTSGNSDSGSGDTGPDPATVLFEEDFEGADNDTVPAGWDSFVAYVVNMNNEPGGMAYALADSTKPHQGTKALHVRGGQSPAMLTHPFAEGVDRVYVRTYVWLSEKIGANPGNNHETLLGIRGSVGQANDEVRFGEIKGVIGTNEVPSDDISPTMAAWGRGPEIEAGVWNCIEVAFLADQPEHEVIGWNNGTEVHRVNDPSQWNNGVLGSAFLTGKFNEFIIGWHSFSNFDNEVWFDDIVVATERVGCN